MWERLGFGRNWVASFATCGEGSECKQLVLLQFQGEGAIAVKELEKKTQLQSGPHTMAQKSS